MYVVARGVDNNANPDENDGKMFEVGVSLPPIGNQPPEVSAGPDQTVTLPAGNARRVGHRRRASHGVERDVDVDPGLGPRRRDVRRPTSASTGHVLRRRVLHPSLTATDTELQASDDVVVTVQAERHDDARGFGRRELRRRGGEGGHGRGGARQRRAEHGVQHLDDHRRAQVPRRDDPPGATITSAYVQFQAKKTVPAGDADDRGSSGRQPGHLPRAQPSTSRADPEPSPTCRGRRRRGTSSTSEVRRSRHPTSPPCCRRSSTVPCGTPATPSC